MNTALDSNRFIVGSGFLGGWFPVPCFNGVLIGYGSMDLLNPAPEKLIGGSYPE